MKHGMFITIEGTDGSGKTTQIQKMKQYLENLGCRVLLTREPGGTGIGEKIRSITLDTENTMMGRATEMLLYAAARAQLVAEVIKPAIESGTFVICDRFVDSSYVYQGFARGIDMEIVERVNEFAIEGIYPDITFFLDVSPDVALPRRIASTGADRIEKEDMKFHWRVYEGYKKLADRYPERIKPVDGNRTVNEIFEDIRHYLDISLSNKNY